LKSPSDQRSRRWARTEDAQQSAVGNDLECLKDCHRSATVRLTQILAGQSGEVGFVDNDESALPLRAAHENNGKPVRIHGLASSAIPEPEYWMSFVSLFYNVK
jgi:hypothetical protein